MEMQRQIWKRAGAGLTAALVLAAGFLLGNGQVNAQTTPQQALQELQLEDAAAILTDGPDSYSKQGNKALVLHDRLLDAVYPAQTGSTAYDALVSGGADSTGYAQAMALLLEEVGLENSLVTDPATGESWNRVRIDGSWYNLSVYRDDLSGRRTAFLKSDSAFADLLGSDPSSWEGENPCTSTYYDNWFLNQSQDGGDVWKNDLYYTNGSGTLYAGYLMGTATHSGLYREETGLDFVDACAAFDGSLYLIGSLNSRQGLYLYEGSSSVEIGLDGTLVHRGSVTPVEQDISHPYPGGLANGADDGLRRGDSRQRGAHLHRLWGSGGDSIPKPGARLFRLDCGSEPVFGAGRQAGTGLRQLRGSGNETPALRRCESGRRRLGAGRDEAGAIRGGKHPASSGP